MNQDADEQETADLTRLVEALHPSKEEDERAERFAARLLERPTTAAGAAPAAVSEAVPDEIAVPSATPAPVADTSQRAWQRDLVMAAIGFAVGVVATLIVVSLT